MMLSRIPSRPCLRYLTSSAVTLAGHNKWSKIKEGKGANDQAKSRIYGRANREILNAVKRGDSADPALNSALAAAVSKAKEAGVPKANIQAALDQASKTEHTSANQKLQYEAMFAGKVGLIIDCNSDNSTRTLRELKTIFKAHGAQLAAVSYMFNERALIYVWLRPDQTYEGLFMDALDNGALDVRENSPEFSDDEEIKEVIIAPDHCGQLAERLEKHDYRVIGTGKTHLPLDVGVVVDHETSEAALALIEKIKDHPDVSHVHVSPEL